MAKSTSRLGRGLGSLISGGAVLPAEETATKAPNYTSSDGPTHSASKIQAAGSFLFCRKQDFHEIGGFPETMYAGEELGFVRKLKKLNRHSSEKFHILENPPVITSSRKLKWYGNMQMAFYLALLFIFPLAVRFQKLCGFWYNRPHK